MRHYNRFLNHTNKVTIGNGSTTKRDAHIATIYKEIICYSEGSGLTRLFVYIRRQKHFFMIKVGFFKKKSVLINTGKLLYRFGPGNIYLEKKNIQRFKVRIRLIRQNTLKTFIFL